MRIIIVDYSNPVCPSVVTNTDGEVEFFDSEQEADEYGKDLQDGCWQLVKIP